MVEREFLYPHLVSLLSQNYLFSSFLFGYRAYPGTRSSILETCKGELVTRIAELVDGLGRISFVDACIDIKNIIHSRETQHFKNSLTGIGKFDFADPAELLDH